jgi:uncharacterized ferredoxin-like protein
VENVAKKNKRSYTDRTFDLHENDADYLRDTRALFLEVAKTEKTIVIHCDHNGALRSKADIAREVFASVRDVASFTVKS